MKFAYIPILLAGLSIPSFTSGADSPTLEETWNLEEPKFNYTNKQFTLEYQFSEYIKEEHQTKAKIYFYKDEDFDGPNNCKSETKENSYEGVGLTLEASSIVTLPTTDDTVIPYGVRKTEKVAITLNTDKIDQDDDVFFPGDGTSSIKFCVRFGLCTGDCDKPDESYEVNFLESLVELIVDLRGEFTVEDISVAPKKKLKRTANQEYGLEAFQCKGKDINGGKRYTNVEPDVPPTFNQGDVITICVQPDSVALGDNIFMKKVEKFTYVLEKEDQSESLVQQPAIDIDNCDDNDDACLGEMFGLTEIDLCTGEAACVIKTILFATFYTRKGSVTGTGSATMQFGTAGSDGNTDVRKLRGAGRQLQDQFPSLGEDVAGAGEFDLSFQIDRSDDPFYARSSASSSMSILALVGSAAAALML